MDLEQKEEKGNKIIKGRLKSGTRVERKDRQVEKATKRGREREEVVRSAFRRF